MTGGSPLRPGVLWPGLVLVCVLAVALGTVLRRQSHERSARRICVLLDVLFDRMAEEEPFFRGFPSGKIAVEDLRPLLGKNYRSTIHGLADGERVVLDERYLRRTLREIRKEAPGVSAGEREKRTAVHYVPILAHERAHLADAERAPVGRPSFYLLEEERDARIAEVVAIRWTLRRFPEARRASTYVSRGQARILADWERHGPAMIDYYAESILKPVKGYVPSIFSEKDVEELRSRVPQGAYLGRLLRRCREEYSSRRVRSAKCRGFAHRDLWLKRVSNGHILTERSARAFIAQGREIEETLSKLDAVREYYKRTECDGWRLWREHHPDGRAKIPERCRAAARDRRAIGSFEVR